MPIQYYDPQTGLWLASCQEGTPCPFPGAVEVPSEAQEGGGEGMRWDGTAWVAYAPVDQKLSGVEFAGVMCSATAQDQAGLTAVLLAIQMQGAGFKPTRFYFENGSQLVIDLANWQAFAAVWMPFRQSFFAV